MFDCGAILIRNLHGSFVANKLSIMRMDSYHSAIDIRGTGMNSGKTVLRKVEVQTRSSPYSLSIVNIHFASIAQSSFNGKVYLQALEKITVENNVITPYSPTGQAIYLDGIASDASSISNDHLFSRIYVRQSSITIKENIIQESVIEGIIVNEGYAIHILNNNITKCKSSSDVVMVNKGYAIHILDNNITKCKSSSDVVRLFVATGLFHFANNTITKNQGWYVFSLEAYQRGSLQFVNNTILQNHAKTIFHLMGSLSMYITTSHILSNVVSSNIGTEALLKLSGFPLGSFTENLFANNSAPMSIDVNMPDLDEDTI
jgi:hypothetical protein